jgi:hypothetical protein
MPDVFCLPKTRLFTVDSILRQHHSRADGQIESHDGHDDDEIESVKGNMGYMMRNVPTVLDFVRCAQEVTTEIL